MSAQLWIKAGKEKALLRRHPWVFTGAVHKIKGKPGLGDTVDIVDHKGNWLARGAYSPQSQICARVWTFDADETIDSAFFLQRLQQAKSLRDDLLPAATSGYRLCAAESDGLPGITIDVYADIIVCQLLSTGGERHRGDLIEALRTLYPAYRIYERSDVDVRKKEGLTPVTGALHGDIPQAPVVIEENGLKLEVDVVNGHKTGYYLDQRDARQAIRRYASGKRVLNCFSYTGGFGVYAAAAGASEVVNVDMSQTALDTARQNMALNGLTTPTQYIQDDVFAYLRTCQRQQRFDVIVLDPPKFVDSKANLTRACRGYKDINRLAAQLLNPGGILLTFSCSGLLSSELFQKVVADGILDANRQAQIIERTFQAADHPVATPYPEGLYLKGLIVRMN